MNSTTGRSGVRTERFTLGTDVLVHAVDRAAGERHSRAVEIIDRVARCDCWLTLQAVSEFYATVTRKQLAPAKEAAALAADWLDLLPAAAASPDAVRAALALAGAGRASYRDALLVATAAEAGCTAILTEDLADGTGLHGVHVINPFGGSELTEPARHLLSPGA
ncbi:MAG TPA: PIN domain-containing protein [Acetobacteraceae bacterium]|nr:PIN domain-containing protein [Acetobacteraceae bacterium]